MACPEVVSVPAPRCDRCCARPVVTWAMLDSDLDERDLEMCGHHSAEHAEAMVAEGWVLVEDKREVAVRG